MVEEADWTGAWIQILKKGAEYATKCGDDDVAESLYGEACYLEEEANNGGEDEEE